MRRSRAIHVVLLFAAASTTALRGETPNPEHPRDIEYPELNYTVPPASQFRALLSNGMVVYIAEDRMLPTFDLSVTIRTGSAQWGLDMFRDSFDHCYEEGGSPRCPG